MDNDQRPSIEQVEKVRSVRSIEEEASTSSPEFRVTVSSRRSTTRRWTVVVDRFGRPVEYDVDGPGLCALLDALVLDLDIY
jgi:hypothetical protein